MLHREPEYSAPAPRRPRGRMLLRIVIIAVLVVAVGARGAAVLWTDYLWFSSVDLTSVWRTLIFSRVLLVVVASAVAFLILWANLLIADRLSPRFPPLGGQGDELVERFQSWSETRSTRIYLVVAAFFGILVGLSAGGWWEDALSWAYSVPFDQQDPVFNTDISFFVFRMPLYRDLFGWFFQFLLITTVLVGVLHYLNGGIRLQPGFQGERVTPGVKLHLSLLLAVLALLKAVGYWLDRYDLLYSTRGAVFGATYTDVNAQLPALNLLIFISIFAALLLLVNIRFRGWMLPAVAGGLWLATSVIVGGIIPLAVQRFRVEPDEFNREREFIADNILYTRDAYGLDGIEVLSFSGAPDLTADDLEENASTVDNIRLWDPDVLRTTYRQLEALRTYYQFQDVDVDRYQLNEDLTQVMLSARELDVGGEIVGFERSWVNDHLVFTHGFATVVSTANAVTVEGQPDFVVNDIPPISDVENLELEEPRIYFGEGVRSSNFVIAGTLEQEVDSLTEDGQIRFNSYEGTGGVQAGNFFRRLAFALRFADINTLISNRVTSDSRVLLYRNLRDRVDQVAPYLSFDADPYVVISDGKLLWVVDAYTTTDRFPYSTRANTNRLAARVDHSLPNDFNYIRNSVKVVVDAFEGSMDFYVVDPTDPVVQVYRRIFPDVYSDFEDMPADVVDHLRYPEDLFRVQGDMYTRYHVTNSQVFYTESDPWSIARDPSNTGSDALRVALGSGETPPMLPYYLLMTLPQEDEPSFLILQPFTPEDRPNMVSFVVAKSDREQYGRMIDYQFPSGNPPDGPNQVSARINQDPEISAQFTLLGQQGSRVIQGDMLVIPIEESIIYVQPIYLQGDREDAIPEFKRAVVVFGDQIVMRDTLTEAIAEVFGTPTEPTEPTDPGEPGEPLPPELSEPVAELLAQADAAFREADEALRAGDLAEYQRKVQEADDLISQALELLGALPEGEAATTATG